MEWQDCQFISISLREHKVLLIDNKTGNTLGKFSYPATMLPTALFINHKKNKACLSLTEDKQGAVYIFHLDKMKSYRLPTEIPAPLQFTITEDFQSAYFVGHDAVLYHLDPSTLKHKPLAQSEDTTCTGIIAANNKLYTIWEKDGRGILTIFSAEGILLHEQEISAIPTNLFLYQNEIWVTYTESTNFGEGIAILDDATDKVQYVTIQELPTPYTPHIYPCSITINRQQDLAYIVHEDGGLISIMNPLEHTVHKTFNVGRSITQLHLLPDERFALATSNMFADLSLIDLVNCKLIAVSESPQEFSHLLSII